MATTGSGPLEDPSQNPNARHEFYKARNRSKAKIPDIVTPIPGQESTAKDPGHPYSRTENIQFDFYDQRTSNAPFGYEHFVSVPPGYGKDPERAWPLILFLHGSGESQRGKQASFATLRHGIPKLVLCYDRSKSDPSQASPSISIPLAPHLGKNRQVQAWDKSIDPVPAEVCSALAENFVTVTPSLDMEWGYGWNPAILSALLDEIVERYRIDLDRIHVTGFSMGGYGTWELALHSPDRFASLIPICGGGDPLRASLLNHVPHWIHHGELDDAIPVEASQQMVDALESAGADQVTFTRYPDLKHDSWTAAYNNPEIYSWMLRQRRYHDEGHVSARDRGVSSSG